MNLAEDLIKIGDHILEIWILNLIGNLSMIKHVLGADDNVGLET